MSSNDSPRLPSKGELLADLQLLAVEHPNTPITRNFYRGNGKFKEAHWQKHFASFTLFVKEAGIALPKSPPTPPETIEFVGDRMNIFIPGTRIKTLDELIAYCKVDLLEYQVERFSVNKWEVGAKDADSKIVVEPLFQVKATLRKRVEIVAARKELVLLRTEARDCARVPRPIIRPMSGSGNMLEVSLNDAHIGKLAWPRETGGRPYDTRIAQRTYLEAIEQLLDRAKGYKFESILFVVGNDLIHSDDLQGRTTRGTVVDCDTRYYKTFEIVRETITICIERLRKLAPVTVKMVQGNHDTLSVWHLGDSLSAIFSKYDDVVIDNEPTYRKYHQWGKCGLLLTHGDKGKRADFPLLFATERPDIFGATKWREVHTGHLHQTKTEEFHGVRVRIIPSLSPADAWHSEMGFTGQLRVAEAFVFNKEEGLIAQFYFNADANEGK